MVLARIRRFLSHDFAFELETLQDVVELPDLSWVDEWIENVRDYIYVSDVVRANMAAIDGKIGEATINVSTGIATSTLELAQTLQDLSGSNGEIAFGPHRVGDVERSVLDPGDFARLGETVGLREGLKQTIAWFRQSDAGR